MPQFPSIQRSLSCLAQPAAEPATARQERGCRYRRSGILAFRTSIVGCPATRGRAAQASRAIRNPVAVTAEACPFARCAAPRNSRDMNTPIQRRAGLRSRRQLLDVSRNPFQGLSRISVGRRERIDDPDPVKDLPVLQVLCQQDSASTRLSGSDDEGVPPREPIAFLNRPSSLKESEVGLNRSPHSECLDDLARLGRRISRAPRPSEGREQFLQDLKADTACPGNRQPFDPPFGEPLLGRI